MNSDRFKKIVEYNKSHKKEITEEIRVFYSELGLSSGENILRLDQIAREEFGKRKFVMIELPLKDKEIGAMAYKGDFWGYVFINSTLPKVTVNFALCHEFYHVFFHPDSFRNTVELFIEEQYYDDENERKANLFAGTLLMPETSFCKMFELFRQNSGSDVETICKLMNYYEAPYMATVIRSYELELFDTDSQRVKRLINTDKNEIRSIFEEKWLDDKILKETGNDQFDRLMVMVDCFGEKEVSSGRIKENSLKKIKANLRRIYKELV